ncbi:reverse transcriptase [Gossypium australe]|uniref:Reverse transcriptase n=1 Tax=Gossypium australe TaxID=47621 RepID=A0A5B6UQZ9_9ROSI|nr:reverse transcriptase [Gossypium australe]
MQHVTLEFRIQLLTLGDNVDLVLVEQLTYLSKQHRDLLTTEESYYRQRSRIIWIREGDQNTHVFLSKFSVIKSRNGRSSIKVLMNDNGDRLESQEELEKGVEQRDLMKPLGRGEIKEAMFSQYSDKALGLDDSVRNCGGGCDTGSCITRILVNSLVKFLPSCIAPNQSVFIQVRSISENILLAQELGCITKFRFSISINGSLEGYFKGAKGIRQGDALCPYIFVMAMDVLSRLLDKATTSQIFHYRPRA